MKQFIKDFIERIGLDKLAHFGIGGLICAFFAIICLLSYNCTPFVSYISGLLVTVLMALIKELLVDDEADRWDFIWSVLGTLPILLALTA